MRSPTTVDSAVCEEDFTLVRVIAARFRTLDPDDLESHLAITLLQIRMASQQSIRDRRAYEAKVLFNKASNYVRRERARNKLLSQSHEVNESALALIARPPANEAARWEFEMAFQLAWRLLSKSERQLWRALLRVRGVQSEAAQQLGVHRNTTRRRLRRMIEVLRRAGIEP
jgi:DNA-binding PucR family transcriptional regulator